MGSQRNPARHGYELVLRKDGKKLHFEASGISDALRMAQALLPADAAASLAEDGEPLAEVSCSADGFWSVDRAVAGRR